MSCPVEIVHSGVVLSPLTLFTLLTSITNHTHVHPLVFRHEEFEFLLNFYPSMTVLTPDEMGNRIKYPGSFCHFQGADQQRTQAWLSACDPDGIEMKLHIPQASFALEQSNGTFRLVSNAPENCDLLFAPVRKRRAATAPKTFVAWALDPNVRAQPYPDYYEQYAHLFVRKRYIEVALFAHSSLLKKYGNDMAVTKERMLSVFHSATSFFVSLNIELRLTHLEIGEEGGHMDKYTRFTQVDVDDDWQKYLIKYKDVFKFPYDHAVLFHALDPAPAKKAKVTGTTLWNRMCWNGVKSAFSIEDEGNPAAGIGNTIARIIGHTLGMESDDKNSENLICECHVPNYDCIMKSNARHNAQFWSNCSLEYLDRKYKNDADYCMWNEPAPLPEFAAPKCGNGIVEEGEECDCGEFGCIIHKCCDQNCKFIQPAKCAAGACCDLKTCSIRPITRMCRGAKRTCDKAEYCDGVSSECPEDVHYADGEACPDDSEAICYRGRCGSRKLQCGEVFGTAAKPAEKSCDGSECGQLYCSTQEKYTSNAFETDAAMSKTEGTCARISTIYQDGYQPDYRFGMTPDGTSCGHGMFCLQTKCVSKTALLGCVFELFYDQTRSCQSDYRCSKPLWHGNPKIMTCTPDSSLQAESGDRSWIDISKVTCPNEMFEIYSKERGKLSAHPVNFRCVLNFIGQFYGPQDCKSDEICAMPKHCDQILCDSQSALQIKTQTEEWKVVSAVSCATDVFIGTFADGTSFTETSVRIKCVKLKCTECEDPCPKCKELNTNYQYNSDFKRSPTWDVCTKFECGDDTRTILEHDPATSTKVDDRNTKLVCGSVENGITTWTATTTKADGTTKKLTQAVKEVNCEKLCTLKSPLNIRCDPKDTFCEEVVPNNDNKAECVDKTLKMFYETNGNHVQIESLKCDRNVGYWMAEKAGNGVPEPPVPTGSNLYCHHGCNLDPYYDQAKCGVGNECEMPVFGSEHCKNGFGLQVDFGDNQTPPGWNAVTSIVCIKNRLKAKNNEIVLDAFPHGIRCIQKDIKHFFDATAADCTADQDCEKPQNCENLKCDEKWALQVKTNEWKVVTSAIRCNSDKFVENDNQIMTTDPAGIRCVRLKCSLCANPVPSLDGLFYTPSLAWNKCSKFTCGQHTRMKLAASPASYLINARLVCDSVQGPITTWKAGADLMETTEITCEKLCTLNSPIRTECAQGDLFCTELTPSDDNPVVCPASSKMFYEITTPIEISSLSCDKGEWIADRKDDGAKEVVPTGSNIYCHHGCDVPYNEQCGAENECLESDSVCPSGYQLQVDFGAQNPPGWNAVSSLKCVNHRVKVYKAPNYEIAAFPHGSRCIRKKIGHFYQAGACEANEDCAQPKIQLESSAALKCDSKWALQVKLEKSWTQVSTVTFDSDKFIVNGSPLKVDPTGVRCVRYKCSLCDNPCPSCANATFKPSTKWNECAEFNCGANTRTVFEGLVDTKIVNANLKCSQVDNEKVIWRANKSLVEATVAGVTCEKLCTLQSPLVSGDCLPKDANCKQWKQDDDKPEKCADKMYYTFNNEAPVEISNLRCNKQDGIWRVDKDKGRNNEMLVKGSNVYCYEGYCNESIIFPPCDGAENCIKYGISGNRFDCHGTAVFWSRKSEWKKWVKMVGIHELHCWGGYVIANGTRMPHGFQARCIDDPPGLGALAYAVIAFFSMLILAVIIATIVLRVMGKGWIHTIILEKARRGKAKGKKPIEKKEKGKKSIKKGVKPLKNKKNIPPTSQEPAKTSEPTKTSEPIS